MAELVGLPLSCIQNVIFPLNPTLGMVYLTTDAMLWHQIN